MLRFIVLLIIIYIAYYFFRNALTGKTTKKVSSQSERKDRKYAKVVDAHVKEIAYVFYATSNDEKVCDVCQSLEGRYLLPDHKMLSHLKPPHIACKNPDGCRCTLVYVTRDEEGSREVEYFLRKHGGMSDRKTIRKYVSGSVT